MSLAEVYQDALEDRFGYPKGWMANWPPGFDHPLGAVGRIDEGMINQAAMLSDKGVDATEDPDRGTPDGSWMFRSDKNIAVAFGADAATSGWEWIGNAKAGVKVVFGSSEGVVLGVGSSHQERLLNIDGLRAPLLQAAEDGKIEIGQAVIVEKHVADQGIQITSQGHNASFLATTNAEVGLAGGPSLASFAIDLNIHEGSHGATDETYPNGFTVAFRVLKLGTRGYWWWKRVVIEEVDQLRKEDEEELLSDEDYFALLPAAR